MPSPTTARTLLGGLVASTLLLTGCAGQASSAGEEEATIQIVASTNVYGDIASRVAGDRADVTSIVSGAAQDPHSYEATARDRLAFSDAEIVIYNGGGYENFVEPLLDAEGGDEVVVLNASDISEYDQEPEEGEFNEHMWYDFPTIKKVADELASSLGDADEAGRDGYRDNADDLIGELDALLATQNDLAPRVAGSGYLVTEPVPVYLLEASGLENLTPDEFIEAIEEEADVPPAVLNDMLRLIAGGSVAALFYNPQTAGSESEQLRTAAQERDIPVIDVTESIPDGEDYLSWMSGNLDAIEEALA